MAAQKRMPKEERRAQLLRTAFAIVASEGAEALTLGHLAEGAGVTKPIAYEHFGTRAGLLIALYRDYDERQVEATRSALQDQAKNIEDAIRILAAAYVDCVVSAGPEFHAVAAALAASEETLAFRRSLRATYVEQYRRVFAHYLKLPTKGTRTLIVGLLGAMEAISAAVLEGSCTRNEAVATISSMMLSSLQAHCAHRPSRTDKGRSRHA